MWLECNTSQRAKIQKLISADENELVQSDKSRMVLALREILNVNSKKRLTFERFGRYIIFECANNVKKSSQIVKIG